MITGIVNFHKSSGGSSARAVAAVKHFLPRGTKIGHAGTLDPFASGVLLLLIGRATKLCESLMSEPKQYLATVRFGATTATDDVESPQIPFDFQVRPNRADIEKIIPTFLGTIQQRPPAFSALKIAGQRAYDLARRGHELDLQPRAVRIDRIDILHYEWPHLKILIDCGRGTYIRALARDLGQALNVGGFLSALVRTRIGAFHIDHAVTLEQLQADGIEPHLLPATLRA